MKISKLEISKLAKGDRFRLESIPRRTGSVVRIGDGSAIVKYDKLNEDELFGLDSPQYPVAISLNTSVERIEDDKEIE